MSGKQVSSIFLGKSNHMEKNAFAVFSEKKTNVNTIKEDLIKDLIFLYLGLSNSTITAVGARQYIGILRIDTAQNPIGLGVVCLLTQNVSIEVYCDPADREEGYQDDIRFCLIESGPKERRVFKGGTTNR